MSLFNYLKEQFLQNISTAVVALLFLPLGKLLVALSSLIIHYLIPHIDTSLALDMLGTTIPIIIVLLSYLYILKKQIKSLNLQINELQKPSKFLPKFNVLWDENKNPVCKNDKTLLYLYDPFVRPELLRCPQCLVYYCLSLENGTSITLENAQKKLES